MQRTAGAKPAAAPSEAPAEPQYRINPEVEADIDDWKARNPKQAAYLESLTPERIIRKLMLGELQKEQQRQRAREAVIAKFMGDERLLETYTQRARTLAVKNKLDLGSTEALQEVALDLYLADRRSEIIVAKSRGANNGQPPHRIRL